eukprot:TRINITY_DN680_c0_g1_i2.p1 TRINITY_DN680_c0_g1~~TRINITY_DN680_c0_g1_i2.p1  ORF type:complete len:468 (-),score=111.72 TRINITY_DN680_c0_g1_i2:160-1563(-)
MTKAILFLLAAALAVTATHGAQVHALSKSKSKSHSGSQGGKKCESGLDKCKSGQIAACDVKTKKVCECVPVVVAPTAAPTAPPTPTPTPPPLFRRRLLGSKSKSASKSGSKGSKSGSHSKSGSSCPAGTVKKCRQEFHKSKIRCLKDKTFFKKLLAKRPASHLGSARGVCDKDQCLSNPCGSNARCINELDCHGIAAYRCECAVGYQGDGETCEPCPPPAWDANIPPTVLTVDCTEKLPPPPQVRATGNCGEDLSVQYSERSTRTVGTCGNKRIKRVWTATDALGRTITFAQMVMVSDRQAPTLAGIPADSNAQCGAPAPNATVTASDNCVGDTAVTFVSTLFAPSTEACAGGRTNQWVATDACGNKAIGRQTQTYTDTEPPRFLAEAPPQPSPAPLCSEVGATRKIRYIDDCAGLAVRYGMSKSTKDNGDGTSTITTTHTITDRCGNSASLDAELICRNAAPPPQF